MADQVDRRRKPADRQADPGRTAVEARDVDPLVIPELLRNLRPVKGHKYREDQHYGADKNMKEDLLSGILDHFADRGKGEMSIRVHHCARSCSTPRNT